MDLPEFAHKCNQLHEKMKSYMEATNKGTCQMQKLSDREYKYFIGTVFHTEEIDVWLTKEGNPKWGTCIR